jgi:hypothetical protein
MVSPQKTVTTLSLLGVDQTALLHPEAAQVLNSLMRWALRFVPKLLWVPLCNQNSPPWLARREASSHQIKMFQWHLAGTPPQWASILSWQKRGENTAFQIPDECPINVTEGFRQRQTGHQSFQKATFLSTQKWFSILESKGWASRNNGGLSYLPFRAG